MNKDINKAVRSAYIPNQQYAGNTDKDLEPEKIYHITNKYKTLLPNIKGKNILVTETTPDLRDFNIYTTIIYITSPDEAIIRYKNPHYPTDRTKDTRVIKTPHSALNMLTPNRPKTVVFKYYDFNANYPDSIQNIAKRLITHNTEVHLHDLTLNQKHLLPAIANGKQDYIPISNQIYYKNILRKYLKDIKDNKELQHLQYLKTPKPIHYKITAYINIWAPAYGISIPQEPQDITDIQELTNYHKDTMTLYNQLKAYQQYDIPITDDYTICSHCLLPHSIQDEYCLCSNQYIDEDFIAPLEYFPEDYSQPETPTQAQPARAKVTLLTFPTSWNMPILP